MTTHVIHQVSEETSAAFRDTVASIVQTAIGKALARLLAPPANDDGDGGLDEYISGVSDAAAILIASAVTEIVAIHTEPITRRQRRRRRK